MKKQIVNDTLIRFGDVTKKSSIDKVIECNVNMNVSLSNSKRSWIFQSTQSLMIIILVITFLITYIQLRQEVQILEAQMNLINSNLAMLILKNERLHRNINRSNLRYQTAPHFRSYYNNKNVLFYKKNGSEIKLDNNNIISTKFIEDNEKKMENINDRVIRSIFTYEEHNDTENLSRINFQNDTNKDHSIIWSDSRSGRSRRDDGRGPLVATFVGGKPEQHVTDTVYIGPWVKRNESRYSFNKFHLVEDNRSIEITMNGLFMISTQIFYFGESFHYSYWILLNSEGSSITEKIVKCATVSAIPATETSCYTSVIRPLRRGDRLHIQQQERDRLINLSEGHSYVQIILLSNEQQKKRTTTVTSVDRL